MEELIITQQLEKGILGTHETQRFEITYSNKIYYIEIAQCAHRVYKICGEEADRKIMFSLFLMAEELLMLYDGRFYSIEEIKLKSQQLSDSESAEEVKLFKGSRHEYLTSADFCCERSMRLINYERIDNSEMIDRWTELRTKLEIVHPVALISLSGYRLPIDFRIANLSQCMAPLAEIFAKEKHLSPDIWRNGKKELELKKCICFIIEYCGQDIFEKEIKEGIESFVQNLVDIRNYVAHVKLRKGKEYPSGKENIVYAAKMSLLYRRVLLELLGIDYEVYKNNIIMARLEWNNWIERR